MDGRGGGGEGEGRGELGMGNFLVLFFWNRHLSMAMEHTLQQTTSVTCVVCSILNNIYV